MNIQRHRVGFKILILLTLGAMVHGIYADGYRNPPPTAEGIGKSGVNSVFVDDASAISYNPANLALQTNPSLVASLTMARTENTYVNPLAGVPFESDGDWNYLPNLYYSQPIGNNGVAFGLGINTPYGQGISWNQSDFAPGAIPANFVPYEASMMLVNFNPTVSFKIHDSVFVGAGFDVFYSQLELKVMQGTGPLPAPILDLEGEGDAVGYGGNVGLTWLPKEGHRMAITYRSRVDMDYEGDMKIDGANAGDFETTVKFPNIVSVGYGVQLSENVQVEAMAEWLQWSVNESQTIKAGALGSQTVQNNWEDTFTFGLGGSWTATDWLVVRAGYAFLPSPIPDETITPLLPDADRHALSVGLGFALGGHMFDLAYTYSIHSDRAAPVTGASPGTYEIDSNLVGLTYSLSF